MTLPIAVSEQISTQHTDQSVHDSESLRGSHTRSPDVRTDEAIPQLDGPVSIWSSSRRRIPENAENRTRIFSENNLCHVEESIWEKAVMMLTVTEEHMEVRDPLKKEDAMVSIGGHLIEGDMRMEFTLGRGYMHLG